ncbi:hypothetical protein SAMN05421765_2819 [Kaistella antarctica]|uniref:DUF4870 domain-containing protein n=1 Tax=Kaistella antarctica TaxID=266748 RepID=A0A3S4VF47_9FLAO|nr:hypothetical protein HY04_09570 [Kaistella antarctica]SEW16250.1 hypothetical protein SAMN05421765_2819 [Kaistella antarctica]VEH99657.1 Uncharacterised protein [Kaistella antarctica]
MLSTIILTILLFILPIIFVVISERVLRNFNLKNIVKTLNKSFLVQFSLCLLLFLIVWSLNLKYSSQDSNILENTLIETLYYFSVIGIFYYLPPLIILNLITKSWKKPAG